MGDISTVSEWVFFINYVDGELDEGMIGVDQQETNRVHLCCNSRFSGLTLEVPKRANTFGAILAILMLVFVIHFTSVCFLGYLEKPVFYLPSGTSWFCTDLCIWFSVTT